MDVLGPPGCFQSAPGTQRHHCDQSRRSDTFAAGVNTTDPGTSRDGSGARVPGGNCLRISSAVGARSATVTYFVDFTKSLNSAFVTVCASMKNPSTYTACTGRSASLACGPPPPIMNCPPGTHTIPGGASPGAGCGVR